MVRGLLLAFALFFSCAAVATPVGGTAKFLATGKPALIKIEGKGGKLTGDVKTDGNGLISGVFQVELAPLTTDNGLRDSHMREKYLEVAKYPTAKFILQPWAPTQQASNFVGILELKGQSKQVVGQAVVIGGDRFVATFEVSLADFPAIGVPNWLGVTVADSVDVTVEGQLSKEARYVPSKP